jgi:hypothetical protein
MGEGEEMGGVERGRSMTKAMLEGEDGAAKETSAMSWELKKTGSGCSG